MRRLLLLTLAVVGLAAPVSQAGGIAIYKGFIVSAYERRDGDRLVKSFERGNGYMVISLPDGLKQSKVAFILPVKVKGQKLLRISPPFPNLSLTGMIQGTADPKVAGAFILSGAIDYFGGYTAVTMRGSLKDGLKEKISADQEIPKILNVSERYIRRQDDSGYGFYERNGGVTLDVANSSAANGASEDFDTAVARVKALFPSYTVANAL